MTKNGEIILFVPQMVEYGGIERNLVGLSEGLEARGLRSYIVCFFSDIDLSIRSRTPLRLIQLTRSSNPIVKASHLASFLQTHWRASKTKPLLFGIKSAFNMGMKHGCPFVLHFTDPPSLLTPDRAKKSLLRKIRRAGDRFLTRRGTRLANLVITMTNRNAIELKRLYGVNSLVLRQGGKPPSGGQGGGRSPSDRCIQLLSICRLEPSKRLDWVIRSVAELEKIQTGTITLKLIGAGSDQERLVALAAELGVTRQVEFLGAVSEQEIESAYAHASIFVMPALQGYGLPALEALYRRVPVVLNADSGVSEILNGTAWVEVFTGGPKDLSIALAQMIARFRARGT
jgi:glycosyltransferase involved in cell wall biosynthesis